MNDSNEYIVCIVFFCFIILGLVICLINIIVLYSLLLRFEILFVYFIFFKFCLNFVIGEFGWFREFYNKIKIY